MGSLRCEGIRGDGGRGREPTDRHDVVSERDPRFLLVSRPDPAQLVKDGGEQVEERFQPFDVLDHPVRLEVSTHPRSRGAWDRTHHSLSFTSSQILG